MESIKELKERIRVLEEDNKILQNNLTSTVNELEIKNERFLQADTFFKDLPKDFFIKQDAEDFIKSKDILDIEYVINNNKTIIKFLEKIDKFFIDEDNNIYLDKTHLGICKDERFKEFLIIMIPKITYLLHLYSRYYHLYSLVARLDKFTMLGKVKP
jgi:hypothetical protein